MKNICFTISDVSCCGGTERVCLSIANALCEKGYSVHILTGETKKTPFFPCDSRIHIGRMLTNAFERRLRYKHWYRIWKCRRYLKKNKIDVVIDVDTLLSRFSIPATRGTGIKVVSWDHYTYDFSQHEESRRNVLEIIRKDADRMVVLTKTDRNLYIQKQNISPDRIVQIYNPLTFEYKKPIPYRQSKKVIAIGRFSIEKGFDLLLQAWRLVEEKCEDWILEIWGDDGKSLIDLPKIIKESGIQRAFLHSRTNDVKGKLAEAAIFALTSRFEGLGIVLLEACASSLPMIAFNCPNGPREIVEDGINGFLVEPENIEQFAEKLIYLIQHEDVRMVMGKRAFETSKRFCIDNIVPQWIDLIENL